MIEFWRVMGFATVNSDFMNDLVEKIDHGAGSHKELQIFLAKHPWYLRPSRTEVARLFHFFSHPIQTHLYMIQSRLSSIGMNPPEFADEELCSVIGLALIDHVFRDFLRQFAKTPSEFKRFLEGEMEQKSVLHFHLSRQERERLISFILDERIAVAMGEAETVGWVYEGGSQSKAFRDIEEAKMAAAKCEEGSTFSEFKNMPFLAPGKLKTTVLLLQQFAHDKSLIQSLLQGLLGVEAPLTGTKSGDSPESPVSSAPGGS